MSNSLARTRSPLAALALPGALVLGTLGAGCWDHAGIACPEGQEFCNGEDIAVAPVDAAAVLPDVAMAPGDSAEAPDLRAAPDLEPPADMASCLAACAKGCCDPQGVCQSPPSKDKCGPIGGMCVLNCDPMLNDQCAQGACSCGGGPECAKGQRCLNAQCVCDMISCPGCCAGTSCVKPSPSLCGGPGRACAPCDPLVADACNAGLCGCGMGPQCMPGQQCVNGVCACNAKSCPLGCCHNDQCRPNSFVECGELGGKCNACDSFLTDKCLDGACVCGGAAAACGKGQHCLGGKCVCDAKSCPMGCCDVNGMCVPWSPMSCGPPGGACIKCESSVADSCLSGYCVCGANGGQARPCMPGQLCQNGRCVCNAQSCPNGCCDPNNGMCVMMPGPQACGPPGGACMACPLGQMCFNGKCQIGPNSCPMGQLVCAATNQCALAGCVGCLGALAACPPGVCVAGCGGCPGFPKTCVLGNGLLPSCVDANCNNCAGKCL